MIDGDASSAAISPLFFDRFELKYIIPQSWVEPISRFAEIYCDLDHYSQISSDQHYTLNSLYFDTPHFHFLRLKESGQDNRFNLRVRSYGEHPTFPYFLEVKKKLRGFVFKRRAKVNADAWLYTQQRIPCSELYNPLFDAPSQDANRDLFISLTHSYNAEPKIFTQYRRKAYISNVDDYARVTFDRDLRFYRQDDFTMNPNEARLSHYDSEEVFGDPDSNVVLELKSTAQVPFWILDLIKTFELDKCSFSKYGSSMLKVIEEDYYVSNLNRSAIRIF